jgi:DNA-binding NarL/FixJ family response regulator
MDYTSEQVALLKTVKDARAEAVEYFVKARAASARRSDAMTELLRLGLRKADIARELGVSREAISKMMKAR